MIKNIRFKKKSINTENSEIKCVSLTKKTNPITEKNQACLTDLTNVEVCSYGNCLYPHVNLESCGTTNCYKKLHHIC